MSDYYPGIYTIAAIFYFAYWFFKDRQPFNFWWLVLIYIAGILLEIILLSLATKVARRN